jgi:DNA-binding NtrC family response regulator
MSANDDSEELRPGADGGGGALYERLRRFHARIRRGGSRRRTVWVVVPPGADADPPLDRFLAEVRGRGAQVLDARCGGTDAAPFALVRDWLDAAGRRLDDVLGAAAARAVAGERADDLADLAVGSPAGEELVARFEAVRRTLQSLAGDAPLLLVARDAHRADADTLALLDHLSARLPLPRATAEGTREPRLGLVATFDRAARHAPDEGDVEVAEADLPAPEALAEVLAARAVREKLTRLSGGDPRRLRALLLALPDDAPSVEALARATLGEAARALLDALAVFDRPATPAELLAATGLPAAALAGARAQLAALDALRPVGERLALGALFDGAVLRERLPEGERAALHQRVAAALDAAGPPLTPAARAARAEEAARHLLLAGERERGRTAALAAAEGLLAAHTPYRALDVLDRLERLAPTRPDAAATPAATPAAAARDDEHRAALRLRAEACERIGAADEAEALRRALLAAATGTPAAAAEGLRLGALLLRRGAAAEALEVLAAAQDAAHTAPPEHGARVAALRAEAAFRAGAREVAEAAARAALVEGTARDLPEVVLTAGHALGKLLATEGRDEEAAAVFRQMLGVADAHGRPAEAARALHNLGVLALGRGAMLDARRHFEASLERSERAGLLLGMGLALTNLAVVHAHIQQLGPAVRAMRRAVAAFEDLDDGAHLAVALGDLSSLLLQVGDLAGARRTAVRARALAAAARQARLVAVAQLREAEVALEEGRWGQAELDLREARDAFAAAHDELDRGWAQLGLARVAEGRRDAAAALAALEELERLDAVPVISELRGLGQLVRARVHLADDLADAAEAALDEAVVALDGTGAPVPLAEALSRKARAVERRGERERALALHAEAAALLGEVEATLPEDLHASFRARRAVARTLAAARRAERDDARERTAGAAGPAGDTDAAADAEPEPLGLAPPAEPAAPRDGTTAAWRARFAGILGESRPLRQVLQMVDRFAPVDATVLLLGESGVGKELVAEALHRLSRRREGPFERINAAALTETLLLSELFGHEKGAFTGAVQRVRGAFERAHGGTIFLDEIGDISPNAQVSLLRVLQEKEVLRVGGARPIKVDVRIVCATNRDLDQLVAAGRFRLDLYHRLRGLTVRVPPLRERPDDVAPIALGLLGDVAREVGHPVRLADDAVDLLAAQPWPGNVRELQNVLRSVAVLTDAPLLRARDFVRHAGLDASAAPGAAPPREPAAHETPGGPVIVPSELEVGFSLSDARRQLEVSCIKRALGQASGNITQAARLLGMKRPRLSQKIKELGIPLPRGAS